jgi:enterochelin esterase-like enzyme
MKNLHSHLLTILAVLSGMIFLLNESVLAQWQPTPGDTLVSYRIQPDNRVLFRIYAPNSENVKLGGPDIPNLGQGAEMTRLDNGVWEVTVGPVKPGAYRYIFNVDGVSVMDPRNPITSESNMNAWSLIYISGADFMDTKKVPHGAVAEVTYYSKSLQRFRRMHVYTPPGYESGKGNFPVFYLLHGAFDTDDAWTTVGRAQFIFDNLIAGNKIEPMVVIMPAGHTGPFRFGMPLPKTDEFVEDFVNDIMPYAESHYRVYTDQQHRAIAGLSMGGAQTLNIAIRDLNKFGYIGVFSSGIFGITGDQRFGAQTGPSWEEQHKDALNNEEAKQGLRLVWFATGKKDFLVQTSHATVEMLRKHGFDVTFKQTEGAHTWENWRDYLHKFAQLIFR